jgi:hypothetical protein
MKLCCRSSTVPVVPNLPGLKFQALHTADAEAYRLAIHADVRGAFNLAADPVVDAALLAECLHRPCGRAQGCPPHRSPPLRPEQVGGGPSGSSRRQEGGTANLWG